MPVRSYVKVYGPPLLEAFKTLSTMPLEELEVTVNTTRGVMGKQDWYFEWTNKEPDYKQYIRLMELLDEYLTPLKVWYTVETRKG